MDNSDGNAMTKAVAVPTPSAQRRWLLVDVDVTDF